MAKTSGRRSLADLQAAKLALEIRPTRKLSTMERKCWRRVVSAWTVDHFILSDAELLTQYCAACEAFEMARERGELKEMATAGRLALSYATKLRITPQSRYDEKAAHVSATRGRAVEAAAHRLIGGIGWRNQPEAQTN